MLGVNLGTFWGVFFALFVFGAGYNAFVNWAEQYGYTEGYTSLLVVLGVGVTLGGLAVVDFRGALLALLLFIASGLPMVAGSVARYVRRRAASLKAIIDEVQDGDQAA